MTDSAKAKVVDHYVNAWKWTHSQRHPPLVVATMLYGSQNYGLDTPESDVDTKTIVVPRLKGLVLDRRISTELRLEDQSLDIIKDVRDMFDNYLKGNINFLETLYTQYYHVNIDFVDELFELREHRDLIANSKPQSTLAMVKGMAHVKGKLMEEFHPSSAEKFAKYGYNPKELHYLVRLYYFAKCYLDTCDFGVALKYCSAESHRSVNQMVTSFKVDPLPLEDARKEKEHYLEKIDFIAEHSTKLPLYFHRNEVKEYLEDLTVRIISKALKVESEISSWEMP